MSDLKITSSEKEKTKNPKRVEQGKRLAAISREAKERKKQRQEEFFESAEDEGNKIFFVIGLIGAGVLLYKVFSEPSEDAKPERPSETPSEPRRKRSYEPYTMD